ncbi:hypothetical protein K0M31_000127 [Melipona bicolor]|uniref:Uncharacterized protein n=1 Tax=Melipona bicolor TaxID=60889 RepID=A0AA40GCZ8_9HYME|nr:hypothetical protein K0M31_000127 [Melipona bicolor]
MMLQEHGEKPGFREAFSDIKFRGMREKRRVESETTGSETRAEVYTVSTLEQRLEKILGEKHATHITQPIAPIVVVDLCSESFVRQI